MKIREKVFWRLVYFSLIMGNLYEGVQSGGWLNICVAVVVGVMWFLIERMWREIEERRKYE